MLVLWCILGSFCWLLERKGKQTLQPTGKLQWQSRANKLEHLPDISLHQTAQATSCPVPTWRSMGPHTVFPFNKKRINPYLWHHDVFPPFPPPIFFVPRYPRSFTLDIRQLPPTGKQLPKGQRDSAITSSKACWKWIPLSWQWIHWGHTGRDLLRVWIAKKKHV